MKYIRSIIVAGFALGIAYTGLFGSANAQGPAQCNVNLAAPTYQDGQNRPLSCDTAGNLRTGVTVTANFAGFDPLTTGTPLVAANPAVTGNLPAGAVVVASNVGATNTAFCKLGATATTSDQPITPGGWFAFTVGVATQLTCITSASTTTVNMVGGSGLPTGTAAGGAVTQGTSPWVVSWTNFPQVTANAGTNLNTSALALEAGGNLAQMVTDMGAPGAVACATDTSSCNFNQQFQRVMQRLTTINTTLGSPFQAGGALAANQSVNVAQINGATPLMGAGNTGTGSPRVTVATDQAALAAWGQGATGAAVPAGAQYQGVNVGGNLTPLVGDPCQTVVRLYAPINIATATTTRLVAPTSAKKTYICALFLFAAAAQNVGIVEGTGGTCGSSTAGVIGGTTAATGVQLTAQAGFVLPSTGYANAATAGTNVDFCLITSTTGQLSGNIVYVQAP